MQLQNGTTSQANTPFAQPQTPINNIQSLTLDTLSPAQLNNNATAQSSPRTAVLNGSQQMQRNQSRSTGIGVGSGSMLPPQSPANRTTTPKPIGVGIGVGVGKATPKMVKEELVSRASRPLCAIRANILEGHHAQITPAIAKQRNSPYSRSRGDGIDPWPHSLTALRIDHFPSSASDRYSTQGRGIDFDHRPSSWRRDRSKFLCRFHRYEFPRWGFQFRCFRIR
jgi:hypothetical protein